MSPPPIEFPAVGLSDARVRLRLMTDADVPAVVEAVNDPDIQRFTTVPTPYGNEDARHWKRTSGAGLASGTDLATLIVDADDGALLGSVGLHNIDPGSGRCAAGYWVVAAARGRNAARRGLQLLCAYGFSDLGIKRVELWIEPVNRPSIQVAEQAGFTREGLLRSFAVIAGQRRDMLMYSLLASDSPPPSGDELG